MSFRLRLTLLATIAVAFAVLVASGLTYASLRSSLYLPIDASLERDANFFQTVSEFNEALPQPPRPRGGALNFIQVLDEQGEVDPDRVTEMQPRPRTPTPVAPGNGGAPSAGFGRGPGGGRPPQQNREPTEVVPLRVTDATRAVLAGDRERVLEDQRVGDEHLRVMNAQLESGGVVQIARSLDEIDDTLAHTRNLLLAVLAGAIVLAGLLGLAVTRVATTPVRRLERTMGIIATDADLSIRIAETGNDEIGRLARRFNTMLDALSDARRAQQQMVEDASHELRTPLTSIKTNLEVLGLAQELSDAQRDLLADVDVQIDELSELVANLVELAHGNRPAGEQQIVQLPELVSDSVARAERASGGRISYRMTAEPCSVLVDRDRLQSAVDNLLSNANKWSPPDGEVTVDVRDGVVTVTDQGPGVPAEDRAHVFDRFYRSVSARGMPGAGLGLAIVKAVAEEHGGTVSLGEGPGGTGAQLRLALPQAAASSQPS